MFTSSSGAGLSTWGAHSAAWIRCASRMQSESKTLAKDAERARRRKLEESYNQIKRRTLPPTFERGGTDWLEAEKPHLSQRTYEIYEVASRCHLKPVLGSFLLCDIDADEIVDNREQV